MRNWNSVELAKEPELLRVASLPMRNWNADIFQIYFRYISVASLPMRNWNCPLQLSFLQRLSVASLPMRNWNFSKIVQVAFEERSCEPTYEELKLVKVAVFPSSVFMLRAYLWGIETLPPFSLISFLIILLRAYLWGIETKQNLSLFLENISVASLPMRNWNSFPLPVALAVLICCEPTYEELKLLNPIFSFQEQESCEPTYEELKLVNM